MRVFESMLAELNTCFGPADTLSRTWTIPGLAAELKRRAEGPSRLIGVSQPTPYLEDRSSPIARRIYDAWSNKLVGSRQTYIIYAPSGSGKSAALQNFTANALTSADRKSLYINVRDSIDIVEALQKVLNTTCDSFGIVEALVSALGLGKIEVSEATKPSYLILDEVNTLNENTESFVQNLFQKVASENIACVIACNRKETADGLVSLNGSKIVPHPSFLKANTEYDPVRRSPIIWEENITWTDAELVALLHCHFPDVTAIDRTTLVQSLSPNRRKPRDVITEYIRASHPP